MVKQFEKIKERNIKARSKYNKAHIIGVYKQSIEKKAAANNIHMNVKKTTSNIYYTYI